MFKTSDIQNIMEETNYILFNIPWEDILPKQEFIKNKNWKARLYIDEDIENLLNLFLDATELYKNSELYGCIFEKNSIKNIKIVKVEKSLNELYSLLFEYGDNMSFIDHCLITNETMDFFFVKESEREIFYIFGEDEFIKKIMPIKFESYKLLFKTTMNEYILSNEKYKARKMKLFWKTFIPPYLKGGAKT